jgi:lysophospholipase L1-like esterase
MVNMTCPRVFAAALTLAAGALVPPRAAPAGTIRDYIAVGDSLAFGETNWTSNPSFGDRGYVKPYADSLASQNGGVRPKVINLAVDGETSGSYFNSGPHGDGTTAGLPGPQLNLNYPNPIPTQNSLLLSTISNEKAAGHVIDTVSVQLGANDLLVAVNTPGFFALTPAQQQAKIGQALTTIQGNDTALLTELKTALPHAHLLLMGYPNPFNADPSTPIAKLADPAIKALNSLIAGEAAAFGGRYVDTYTPFKGHELAYTYIASGNVHPNALGYAVIAGQMETVPEPSSVLVFGAGLVGCFTLVRRRARACVA